ncbi:MAG TPA: isoprenylcysteine carboxylmethyltransferase family protein [Candidatus Thermoplasmatota archaeon]|nr:isoprenylcysteine carboxylmethyltransferase family protein [Candidatus Thermoplasmatota archaeon]
MHPGFWWLVAALGVQRLAEMAAAARNTRKLQESGARLVKDDGYGLLVLTHSLFFAAAIAEALLSPWAGIGPWTLVGLAMLIVGEALRGWSMLELGSRWTTRVVILPKAPLVAKGPYRWLRHPIYVGVTLMIVGFPLAFGLWGTLALAGTLNGVALLRRIRREDRALASVVAG